MFVSQVKAIVAEASYRKKASNLLKSKRSAFNYDRLLIESKNEKRIIFLKQGIKASTTEEYISIKN